MCQQENYLLACQRYIELKSVRTGMVDHPEEYRWSSYLVNAHGEKNDLVCYHSPHMSLGRTVKERNQAYRELFRHELDPGMVNEIRSSTNGNFALGTDRFKAEIAVASGRPRKKTNLS